MNLPREMLCGVLALLALACGSSPSFAVNGTIHGRALKAGDSMGFAGWLVDVAAGGSRNVAIVEMTNQSRICSLTTATQQRRNSQYLNIIFHDEIDDQIPSITAGAYTAHLSASEQPRKWAWMTYFETDASCQIAVASQASSTSGSVTLTSMNVNNGDLSGSFDVGLDSGDRITGSFKTTHCDGFLAPLLLQQRYCIEAEASE